MKKFLLSIAAAFLTMGAMAQNAVEFTFTRNGENAAVTVNGAENVTATIEATSPSPGASTKTGVWNSGGDMGKEENANVLCTSTNTNAATANAPITYTLTIEGLNGTVNGVSFTHVPVNSAGNKQPKFNENRHCNFIVAANNEEIGTLTDGNIVIQQNDPNNDKTFTFNEFEAFEANGTLTIKLTLYKGTSNNGCFYGLTKITLTQPEEVVKQEVPFLTQVTASDLMAKTEPTKIAIKNLSYTNNRWFVGNTGATPYSAEDFTNDAIFIWEPVENGVAGSYHLKKGDTYMQATSPKDFGTIDNAAVFTATNPTSQGSGSTNFNGDGDSNLYITGSTDANLVRFVKGNNWINIQNGAAGTPTYNTGTGGWTIHYVYEVAEVANFKANITAAGFATFFAPREVTIPEDVKAYYITAEGINGENVTLTEIENVIPANTAVILEGAEDEYTFNVSETGATAVSSNLLKGTIINTNIIGQAYVLGVVEGETGLYKTQMRTVQLSSASGSASVFQNNAYKAYLPASAVPAAAQEVANFSFRFPDTTAIENAEVENAVKTIYDLTGRRVSEITEAGIYIIGGRKVLVK